MERIVQLLQEASIQDLTCIKQAEKLLTDKWGISEALSALLVASAEFRPSSPELYELISGPLKVYLDDERKTPEGWIRAYWPEEVITILQNHEVGELSLDRDLGDDDHGTGYSVLLWIEEQMATTGGLGKFSNSALQLNVHSANSSAKFKMDLAINSITRWQQNDLTI